MRRSAASRPTQRGAGRSPRGWGRPTGACVILGASAGGAEEFGVDAGLVSGDRVVGGVGQLLLLGGGGIQQSGQLLVVQRCRGCWRGCGHVIRPPVGDRRARSSGAPEARERYSAWPRGGSPVRGRLGDGGWPAPDCWRRMAAASARRQ